MDGMGPFGQCRDTPPVNTGVNGSVYETCTSLPFGDSQHCGAWDGSTYFFTGLDRDPETSNDHALFRCYDSSMGRWLSPDPLGGDVSNPQSLNRYAYVLNNPTTFIDPLGLVCQGAWGDPSLGPGGTGVIQITVSVPCSDQTVAGGAPASNKATGAGDAYGTRYKCSDGTHLRDCTADPRVTPGSTPDAKSPGQIPYCLDVFLNTSIEPFVSGIKYVQSAPDDIKNAAGAAQNAGVTLTQLSNEAEASYYLGYTDEDFALRVVPFLSGGAAIAHSFSGYLTTAGQAAAKYAPEAALVVADASLFRGVVVEANAKLNGQCK